MKVRYYMLPVIIFSLMLLVLDNEKTIKNKTMFSENKEVSYPFFGTPEIDKYIEDYLNKYIEVEEEILIDYDYIKENDKYYVTFYKYILDKNKINNDIDTFLIDIKNNIVSKTNPVTFNYDIIQNKVIDKENNLIALTFDDGPNYNTNKILEILEKYNVTATFFVLGSKIRGNEYILKRIIEGGNEIGNHTFNHLILTRLEEDNIKKEIDSTSNQIFEVTGIYPTLLRPSYGIVNKKVKEVSNYPLIIWDIDTLDWKYHNSKKIAKRVLNKASDGSIVLMHDVYSATANSLNIIIPELKNRGYTFVTVSELFYYKEVELEKGKVYGSA